MSQTLLGTDQHDNLTGSSQSDLITGLAGDDTISGGAGNDILVGDTPGENLITDVSDALTFAQYGQDGAWQVHQNGAAQEMSQSVQTLEGSTYTLSFDVASNVSGGTLSGLVEVLWNGEVIDSFDTNSGDFQAHQVSFAGTGGEGVLTFRASESENDAGPTIHDDGPILSYDRGVTIGGEELEVRAVVAGQPYIYQIINGTMFAFDPASESYSQLGADASVVVNSLGFNQEDDLFYGVAVRNGVDSLGNAVAQTDIVMLDAEGNSYRLGESPYRAWTGDFDDQGNLWSFHSSMDRVSVIDVDQFDADGNPVTTVYRFEHDLVTDRVWDLAFDAEAQVFRGVVSPAQEGGIAQLFTVDVSGVSEGGEPQFSTMDISGTIIDGEFHEGAPRVTFGAAVVDRDGTLYVGGNSGDHDMDDSTPSSGGIYRVDINADTGEIVLVLVADAPRSYSNDGAFDPRAIDPFTSVDAGAVVLIDSPDLVLTEDAANSYDDVIDGNAGQDTIQGGIGEDLLIGSSRGDNLDGGAQDDTLYGGAGPDQGGGVISTYDENGLRYDQFGNLLPEDDDILSGGEGNDLLDGSAGHDTLSGGIGDDTLSGGSGDDVLAAGEGDDALSGGAQSDHLMGGAGDDLLNGGSGDDTLDGGTGTDTLEGGSGDDQIRGGTGNDDINAGTGNDVVSGDAGDDRIRSGSGDDVVNGGDGRDYINAHRGDDLIDGGAGRDRIYGGEGNDTMAGGEGADVFIFRAGDLDNSTDRITDFDGDWLDFRALDLLSGGQSEEDWVTQHLIWSDANTLQVTLEGLTLELDDHQNLGNAFLQDVSDAILF
ncbi:calcium-binding protein [Tateyamaria sp. syn59]|uniref:calcium-binding protein n=1 Tax=Tateyamaria sp. syn59 TaxID=2576942 RepID=UPI0011BF993B|nr:calcium-binding protein [Tateyamaria sp. syn59]